MTNETMPKSYVKLYWFIWLILVACLLAVRFFLLSGSQDENITFTLFNIYIIPTFIALIILNLIEGHRLMAYLEQNHHTTWEQITYVPGYGPGGYNSFRSLPFIYSDDNLSDPIVKALKLNYRNFVRLALTVFFTIPLLFVGMMVLP